MGTLVSGNIQCFIEIEHWLEMGQSQSINVIALTLNWLQYQTKWEHQL